MSQQSQKFGKSGQQKHKLSKILTLHVKSLQTADPHILKHIK